MLAQQADTHRLKVPVRIREGQSFGIDRDRQIDRHVSPNQAKVATSYLACFLAFSCLALSGGWLVGHGENIAV